MYRGKKFLRLSFKQHLVIGTLVRLALIVYADYHDQVYDVPYTDVDYKVFTDAARHIVGGDSPYKRHTYRYSPVIAYLMIPNVTVGKDFGKLLFSAFDILVTIAVKLLVEFHLQSNRNKKIVNKIAKYSSLFWLYNPLSIAISTRGNADSVPSFFIILSILFLQTKIIRNGCKFAIAGILLGISIHIRLYPLAFSFPMFLSLGAYKINRRTSIKNGLLSLIPNKKQMILTLSCIATLLLLTYGMFFKYGYEFLFETYIYHFFRRDTRHNFSVLFYYSYLTMDQMAFDTLKSITQIFEFLLLFVVSLTFGRSPRTLGFALFCQAVLLVAFNSVMTSQYFVWFLSLLPLVAHSFKIIQYKAFFLWCVWIFTQCAWLFYAYLLEFKGREVFILIWLKSVVFFCANIYVLGQLIKDYTPGYGFGITKRIKIKFK